ncbi:MAG: Ribosomal RNA small subunit methyltransferase I [Microgenomates group bacterium GW2011_GWA2_46_7]|nr:MAG: Ribosomal RNA small subunit methyltransferase I [Microgenomates group bacterium GW2011_GWA2_46_7]
MNNGCLYVIGTPIGNLKDITFRAIETLNKLEVLVCEDSRITARLINHYIERGLIQHKPRYVPYNEFNEDRIYPSIVEMVKNGQIVGLVSDAGMPTLSDPGYPLVKAILDAKLRLEVIPGPTALTTALPWSGIGGEVALYLGFLPKTSGKVTRILEASKEMMANIPSTRVILYVSPHRLVKDLTLIREVMGEVRCVLMRELTKQFEERIEGKVSELIATYSEKKVKGELVLVISQ